MTHYKRPWPVVLLTALVIVAGAGALSAVVLWLMVPTLLADIRYYGLAWDRTSQVMLAVCIGILATSVWWLRTSRPASGNGFPVSHAADPSDCDRDRFC